MSVYVCVCVCLCVCVCVCVCVRARGVALLSAGVGRTGVFITLSIVLERMRYEGVVDLFQTVKTLRTQRPAMVQTEVNTHTHTHTHTHTLPSLMTNSEGIQMREFIWYE